MLILSTHVDIQAPVDRVWSAIMDFPDYRKWNPFVELSGEAVKGGKITYTFGNPPSAERGASTTAIITSLDDGALLAFKYGIRGLLFVEQSFALEVLASGTRLTHAAKFRGVVAFVSGWAVKKRLMSLLRLPIVSLARQLATSYKPAAAIQPPVANRKARRRRAAVRAGRAASPPSTR